MTKDGTSSDQGGGAQKRVPQTSKTIGYRVSHPDLDAPIIIEFSERSNDVSFERPQEFDGELYLSVPVSVFRQLLTALNLLSDDIEEHESAFADVGSATTATPDADPEFLSVIPTETQIRKMVDRFLTWPVPADFAPDGGVKFEPYRDAGVGFHRPVGTNLFTATQARAMVFHMLGIPDPAPSVAKSES